MSKCTGCGVILQSSNVNEVGYVKEDNIDKLFCERCFRIKNYGEYKVVLKSNSEFIDILKNVNKTGDLVVLVVDIFNLSNNLGIIRNYLDNDILLVLTKRDLFPKSISDEKLLKYIKRYNLGFVDSLVISSNKNYHFDDLLMLINKYKKSNDVYVVGFTNAGKSTMINKIIYNYSTDLKEVTTSILPSTTLNTISIKIDDGLNIIDTPGILGDGSFFDKVDVKTLKKIIPKSEIKPISYQIKGRQYITIDDFVKIDLCDVNIVMYVSNSLNIKRYYKDVELNNLVKHHIFVNNDDIVINGLGFIKVFGTGYIDIYTIDGVLVYTRDSLI